MTVLDATKLESENDLATDIDTGEQLADEIESGEETAEKTAEAAEPSAAPATSPVRQFSLDLPAEAETTIKIIAQQGADCAWRAIYQISRQYETSPHEQHNIDEAVINLEEDGENNLGYVILTTVDEAFLWVSEHSDNSDTKASLVTNYLEQWCVEHDDTSITEAIFDPLPEPAKAEEVTEVAADTTPATACECGNVTDPTSVTITVSNVCPDESKRHWEQRKAEYAWAIADGHMQLADAKARVKSLTKCIENAVERLEQIIEDGPEEMPLFDSKQQQVDPAATEAEKASQPLLNQVAKPEETAATPADTTPATVEAEAIAAPVATDDESWRDVLIEKTNIPAAICKILNEDNQVYTLGQLTDVTAEPNTSLTDLKKIGQAKADKIEEAMCEYWAANPRK
jgi:hypothetical protein